MKNKVQIIAEIGVNHNGDIKNAKKLIKHASNAGADFVKFQTYITEDLVTKNAKLAPYQKRANNNLKQINLLKKYELSFKEFHFLKNFSKKNNINFLSSPFDLKSASFLKKIGMNFFKIPSGEITNIPLLEQISKYNQNVIISTGMSEIDEIEDAVKLFLDNKKYTKKITILHCTSSYPTKLKDVNLNTMLYLKNNFKKYNIGVGLSDHTKSFEAALAATALGAEFIEKHFTLDRNMPGPDHSSSLNPHEFRDFVRLIRNTSILLGSYKKIVTKTEMENLKLVRKSIVAKKNILKGELLTKNNMTIKRPGFGKPPKQFPFLIGTKAKKNYLIDDYI